MEVGKLVNVAFIFPVAWRLTRTSFPFIGAANALPAKASTARTATLEEGMLVENRRLD